MKLRQKLAVVMASAMVVTAVPVVTMASSTAKVSKTITVSNEDPLGDIAPWVEIELNDDVTSGTQFYITLENAKFNKVDDKYEEISKVDGKISVEATSDTEAVVVFTDDVDAEIVKSIRFQLNTVKVTGEAKISIDGNETEISDKKDIVFANKSDSKASVTVKDATKLYTTRTGEKLGDIVITEAVAGSLVGAEAKDRTIVIEMDHDSYEFVEGTELEIVGSKGFSGISGKVTVKNNDNDKDDEFVDFEIVLPAVTKEEAAGKGVFTIKGLKVRSIEEDPTLGDLEVTVYGKDDTKVANTTVVGATVVEFGTELKVDEKDEVKAGKKTKVKLTYAETTADSTPTGDVEFILDKGYFMEDSIESALDGKEWYPVYEKDHKNNKDYIIGFNLKCEVKSGEVDKFIDGKEFEIETTLDMEGEIKVSTNGRYVEDQEVVVANVTPNIKLSGDAMRLKVGQTKQVGGKIVLTEVEKGAFARNKDITLVLAKDSGIKFTELPDVTIDGTTKAEAKWLGGASTTSEITVELDRASRENPSTITLDNIEVTVDRTVPQGSYDLKFKIEDYRGELTYKDFFVIGTPNEEDQLYNGLPVGTASFVIGSAEYTVNGKVATMDAASYIQDPGYTMVPVRYVASAFGVSEKDILFSNGKATIFAGSRTIQLTAGSNTAIVNGVPIDMATKVVIKEGRTYAPVGEIARLLGISVDWNAESKTALFENKVK